MKNVMIWGTKMRYPDYMTQEDIEAFEMDMARFYEDPSVEFDQINRELRELALEQMAEQAELLGFYNG